MIIKILIVLILFLFLEEVLFDFNYSLMKYKKFRPKINILLINFMIILSATIVFIISNNKYDIDKNGKVNFDDVLILKQYVMEKEKE